jgi:ubiquitin-conjugating enzyme E2 W
MAAARRLQKELLKLHDHLPPGIYLVAADDFENWYMDIKVLDDNPIYRGETYRLKFNFSKSYVSHCI